MSDRFWLRVPREVRLPGVDPSDALLLEILEATSTIAMVGASPVPERASYSVMRFLQSQGYCVSPVNSRCIEEAILGERVYRSLADVPGPVDMVDVFRNSREAGTVTDEAIALARDKGVHTLWMQLGVRDDAAAARASAAGIQVVMDRCPKIEFLRLGARRRDLREGGR